MRTVALTMAGGDLTARAEDGSNDEYGELGRALNYLSSELGSTISSLQMERNRLQSLINGLSEGIIAVDAKGATTLINPAVYGLLNLIQSTDDNVRAAAPDVVRHVRSRRSPPRRPSKRPSGRATSRCISPFRRCCCKAAR